MTQREVKCFPITTEEMHIILRCVLYYIFDAILPLPQIHFNWFVHEIWATEIIMKYIKNSVSLFRYATYL